MVTTIGAAEQPLQGAWRGRVALIAKPGGPATGVGRYVHMLQAGLMDAGVDPVRVPPAIPPLPSAGYHLLKRFGIDLKAFLTNYPIWARYPPADVYHLTSQNLASLLLFRRPKGRVVVTVHDIIPYMLRDQPQLSSYRTAADRLFDRMAMAGLRRADALIADSQYTKQCVVDHLRIAPDSISVVYLGIDHARFRPLPVPAAIRERYALPEGRRYLIYVGSEDPRKNLPTLLQALAEVRRALPDVELIKAGRAHFAEERGRLVDLAARLNVSSAIHWLDDVPDQDLPLLYNLADICVMPSLYEGFGFPVLEAIACRTPVIAANAASLPELIQAGAILFDPKDYLALASTVIKYLSADRRGVAQDDRACLVEAFSWETTCAKTLDVYAGA